MDIPDIPEPNPEESALSASQQRRLVELDQHLSAENPALAHALRIGRTPRPISGGRLALALLLAAPLVVFADHLGGPAPVAVEAILLAAWIRCYRP
jgi:hypothetical protein